jgi:hypothetical protein
MVAQSQIATVNERGALIPDPTERTSLELRIAIRNLQDLMETKISGLESLVTAQIQAGSELNMARIHGLETQLREREARTTEAAIGVDRALSAAFAAATAQNESTALLVSKSETTQTKITEAAVTLLNTSTRISDEKLMLLLGRFDRLEGGVQGGSAMRSERHENNSGTMQVIATAIMAVGMIISAITLVAFHH